MPFIYTNRKGVTYTLYRVPGAGGSMQYTFARQSRGEPIDALPPGFHINENPNGIVSLERDRPALILPEEVAAVEEAVQRHLPAGRYRVVARQKRIEIYAKEGRRDILEEYHEKVAAGLALPGREAQMREFDEHYIRFNPVMRFTLLNPTSRQFRVEEFWSIWYFAEWETLGVPGPIAELANTAVPSLAIGLRRPTSAHTLKVTLTGVRPPIWRRIAVSSDITLAQLHAVLQITMGWEEMHLHDFRVGDLTYGDPRLLELKELYDQDERKARLADVAPRARNRLRYRYDFGDNWEHEILVEAAGTPESSVRYPVCLAGERACPPEDSGGAWGYSDMLKAMANRRHPMHDDVVQWLGGLFDPEAFNQDIINYRLA